MSWPRFLARGLADGLIISGPDTGHPASISDLKQARKAVPDGFILVGSGVDSENATELLDQADGAIVGTSLKREGLISNPLVLEWVWRIAPVIETLA